MRRQKRFWCAIALQILAISAFGCECVLQPVEVYLCDANYVGVVRLGKVWRQKEEKPLYLGANEMVSVDGLSATFEPIEDLYGSAPSERIVWTPLLEASCGVEFRSGTRLLLFYGKTNHQVSVCTGTTAEGDDPKDPFGRSYVSLREIRAVVRASVEHRAKLCGRYITK